MTKDEARLAVMGAISMALKDPTLQQGFEIICKNLSELEKENAELNYKLNNLSSVAEVRLANWLKYADAYNETQELLNKQIEATYKVVEKLNEAKAVIQNIIRVTWGEGWNYSLGVKSYAEQLLKE